ncbi:MULTISPECIES: LacI family DNA-binding transcriptional regulator [unclassified Brenneria]|uniref:LacI family DNA-binding transcriptional regulator n=1 Tax=unclassified Brenneria TaxID=2634434 RepID=UPI0029C41407|nr:MULTISPECIES: LacI family DNA-binding transcriptional regulator [unclassified Brenneria]MDX5630075.1 LacI family DNA-binding transcriptional regulator [Brenneria sp. L3-3Z]MDX5697221.1 LacI family DNA-binding transcriptional regulator [Brenneria sp. L4-2C]
MKPKSITLYDVAEYAGVSYQTVSRVINQASHVSEKTRLKVEAAMAALNYVPNRVAQQLAGKLSHTIGLATTNLSLHAPSQIVAAIKSEAGKMQFNVVISMIEQPGLEASRAAINSLLSQRVDGLIVNIPLENDDAQVIMRACGKVPVLFLDVSPSLAANTALFDPHEGARLGVEHLVNLGHRRIALLTGPLTSVSARLRFEGWRQTLTQRQLQPLAVLQGDWSSLSGYEQTARMLAQGALPTALLVANDQMALGALRALSESALAVPGQVSVVGYDDTEDSACFIPPLTTIKQDFKALGKASVHRMIELIHTPDAAPSSQLLPITLVERKTTAAPEESAASPQALADALSALARQVARLEKR